jgi:MFS family permease
VFAFGPSSRFAILGGVVFLNTLCWALAYAVLPFYVHELAPGASDADLYWRGSILGVTPLLTILSMPVWIRVWRGRNPDAAILVALILQTLCFTLTASASSLHGIFVSRLLLGLSGPVLTFAFMAVRLPGTHRASATVAALQSAITVGLVSGPLVGTATAALFGYRLTFSLASMVLFGSGVLFWGRGMPSRVESAPPDVAPSQRRMALFPALVVLVGYLQVFFLNAILPEILAGLRVGRGELLQAGGAVIFVSGLVLALASLRAPDLFRRVDERRFVQIWLGLSSLLLVALPFVGTLWGFLLVRSLQVAALGPLLVLAMANATQWSGQTLGLANSARVAAGAFGPLVATVLVSRFRIHYVFGSVAIFGFVTCVLARSRWRS